MDGNFAFSKNGSDVNVVVSNAAVSLGSGQVAVTGMTGTLDWSSSGFNGSGSAATSFTSDNASFSGTLGFSINTTSGSSDTNLQVTGTGVHVTVDGLQITADIDFEAVDNGGTPSADVVGVSLNNVIVAYGNGTTNYVTLTGASGTSTALFEHDAFVGVVGGTFTISAPGGVSTSGTMTLELNSGTVPYQLPDPTSAASPAPQLTLPAGPMVDVLAQNIALNISSSQSITGTFDFDYDNSDPAGSKTISIVGSGISASLDRLPSTMLRARWWRRAAGSADRCRVDDIRRQHRGGNGKFLGRGWAEGLTRSAGPMSASRSTTSRSPVRSRWMRSPPSPHSTFPMHR